MGSVNIEPILFDLGELLKNLSKFSDKEIIEQILKEGKPDLFGELYDRYSNKVFRKCYSMVSNEMDAQDLAQSILVKAFLNISKFEGRASFSTWIYAITYNSCINFLKNRKRRDYMTDEFDEKFDKVVEEENEIESKKIFEIELEQLKVILEKIKPDDKVLLLMKYQDNLSIEQIAEQLLLSNSAVKMRLLRARGRVQKLREKIFN